MHTDVAIKGVNGELTLVVNGAGEFAAVLAGLDAKLAAAAEFFPPGTVVNLSPGLGVSADERRQLADLLARYGLVCGEPPEPKKARPGPDDYEITALVVPRTLRSGQQVIHDKAVVVFGDVNAGARVVAGGDIIILGACRGVAHAGAAGDETATITAGRIVATQLRIAGLIARAPDDLDKPAYVETARIKDGAVVIEPANR